MKKYLKGVTKILAFTLLLFATANAVAQTVNITTVDPGPYGAGSSIAAKFAINYAAGCLQKSNKFNLYLSNATGDFTNETLIGTYNGYGSGNGAYGTFVNGTIPANTAPGAAYRVRIKTTVPASTSAASDPFVISASPAVQAGVTSSSTMDGFPEVFGKCVVSSSLKDTYNFQNTSTAGTTVSANFYNEQDRKDKGTQTFTGNFISFTADTSTYTVFVKATNGTTVGTKAYLLIENRGITTLSLVTAGPVCLTSNGASVIYNIDYQSPNGLQRNFPGTVYNINWGDGTSNDITLCDIIASQGSLSHNYLKSSCGQKDGNTITNKFKVALTVNNPFCGGGSSIYGQQPVLMPPSNSLSGPSTACTNNEVTFTNGSYPGQSATNNGANCADNTATYSYYVDGVLQATGLKLSDQFKYTFNTHGQHTVVLHLESSSSGCIPADATVNICVQDAPKPKFTLSANTTCIPGTVNVTDNSVTDNVCNSAYTYLWTVTPATGFSYVGTNKNSKEPVFKFTTQGKYAIQLQISAPGNACVAQATVDTVYANSAPQIALSPDFALCGKNQSLRFGAEAGKTKVTYTGTYQLQPDTYVWTVTPPAGGAPATFTNGTTANSQSPTINFPDFGTYVVSVVQKNSCGTSATATQNITFQNAPTVNAGDDQTICANQAAALSATISDASTAAGAPTWSGGTASGFSDVHSYQTSYTPTAAEVNAGFVVLTITVPTTLQGDCSSVSDQVRINLRPFNNVTSAASRGICSGKPVSYQITSTLDGSTFTWTAAGSPNASGFTASGSGDINEAALSNSSATENATVTYTIIPHNNGCDGTPFNFTVTIVPQPIVDATAPAAICSGSKAGIKLTANVSNTTYTWTSTTSDPANVTGLSNASTPATVTEIQDVLANTGSAPATVTYTITSYNSGSSDNCPGNTKTVTITIQPATPVANAGVDQTLCNTPTYQLNGNNLGPNGHGTWTLQSGQSGVTFDDATKYNATVSGLQADQNYTFRWTSTGIAPCGDNFDEVIIRNTINTAKADFTADKTSSCDVTAITFTNTSTPPSGFNYAWDFGNGQTSTLMNPQAVTFIPQTNGKDSIYTVKLTISNNCIIESKSMQITIKPTTPIAQIAPDKTTGCAPFTVNVENLSPGTNDKYTYYLTDANGNIISTKVRTDKYDQPFTITTVGTYKVYMQAQSQCGVAKTTTYTLVVSPATLIPRLTVNGDEGTGCGPLTVTFHNNTTGGSSYRYEWGDGTAPLTTTSTGDVNHTFAKGGDYTVVLHSSNSCTPDVTAVPVIVHVLAQPVLAFNADNTSGCKKLKVQFNNTSIDPSVSQTADLTYDWDFGDGSPHSNAVNPVHNYGFVGSPFTVTLKATNGTGCTSTLVIKDMVRVNQSSLTEFTVKPDSVVNIPIYNFSFVDQTTGGPLTWHWDFGDGSTSNQRNPEHTYADTGRYKVTLTTANAYCDSTKIHYVRITGTPGQVYLPNAFMPNSATPELRTFGAKGSGLKEWHIQILNSYNQVIYESSDLDERGRPTGQWDGTFKGSPVPQGVYIWLATGKFINGNEWKGMSYNADGSGPRRSGVIHLLR